MVRALGCLRAKRSAWLEPQGRALIGGPLNLVSNCGKTSLHSQHASFPDLPLQVAHA